jgi:hypothetical protein
MRRVTCLALEGGEAFENMFWSFPPAFSEIFADVPSCRMLLWKSYTAYLRSLDNESFHFELFPPEPIPVAHS